MKLQSLYLGHQRTFNFFPGGASVSSGTNYFLVYLKDLARRLPQSVMRKQTLRLLAHALLQENVRARLVALEELNEALFMPSIFAIAELASVNFVARILS